MNLTNSRYWKRRETRTQGLTGRIIRNRGTMRKTFLFLAALTVSSASLPAQSTAQSTAGRQLRAAELPVVNVLTVIGDNIPGLPCLDCLLGIAGLTLGLPSPLDEILRGNSYQVAAYMVDNSYTGMCTFTFEVRDVRKRVVVSSTQTLMETAHSRVLVWSPLTIPTTAEIGLGSVSTKAMCGTNSTNRNAKAATSRSPAYICASNPPHCAN